MFVILEIMQPVSIKSFFALVIVTLFTITHTWGQENEILMPYLKGQLYGFANSKGKIVIEPKYESVRPFENGFAVVRLNDKCGIIKENGKFLLELTARGISSFDSNGLAHVITNNLHGVINKKGKWVVPLEYSSLEMKPHFIQVTNSARQSALLDFNGKTIVDFKFNWFRFHEDSLMDSNFIITILDEQYGLIELQDNKYETRIPPHYKRLRVFNKKYFIAEIDRKLGLVNSKDEIILPFEYDEITTEGDFILAEEEVEYEAKIKVVEIEYYRSYRGRDDLEKEYDDDNRIVYFMMSQEEHDNIMAYGSDLRPDIRRRFSLIDKEGQLIIPAQFGEITVNKHLIQVRTDDGVTLFDKKGTRVSPLVFDQVDEISEGLILVKVPSEEKENEDVNQELDETERMINFYNRFKYGFIDTTGEMILPLTYNGAFRFNQGLAPVRKGDKWALMNKTGELVTDFNYDQLYFAGENRYAFRQNKRWGLLDLNGREIIPATYYAYQKAEYETDWFGGYSGLVFKNGLALTTKQLPGFRQQSISLIDTNGIQLFPFKYISIEEQVGGLFKVSLRNHDHEHVSYGLIDKDANVIVPVYQSSVWWLENEKVFVASKYAFRDNYSYYDQTGKEIESPYAAIEREGLREYKLLENGYYSAKYLQYTVYFTPEGIPLFED